MKSISSQAKWILNDFSLFFKKSTKFSKKFSLP